MKAPDNQVEQAGMQAYLHGVHISESIIVYSGSFDHWVWRPMHH